MNIIPREDWQDPAQPVVGPSMSLGKIELVPAHYTASSSVSSDTPSVLRAIQNDYTVNRGYSIGYNFAVDKAGEAWELRGFDFKCAANKDMNEVTIAILCLVDGADAMSPVMVDTFQAIAAECERVVGRDLFVVGHRDIGSTSCPGDGIYGQVQAGLLEPDGDTPPEPEPPGDTDMASSVLILEDANPPGAMYRCGLDTKTWVKDGNMSAQVWMRIEESANGTKVAVDGYIYHYMKNGNLDVIASYGPIVGDIPQGHDEYGRH